MKHTSLRLILCAAILMLCGANAYVNAQSSSTEGRQFWIALTKAKTTGSGGYTPSITVSAKKACHIKITNPNTTWQGVERDINAGTTQFGVSDIPLAQWANTSFNNSDFQVAQNLGLFLESTENVSVYVASRMEYSFDATNVLPLTALTGEYMIQDYPACDHEDKADQNSATFVVVATEDNTNVTIVPTYPTRNGNAAGSTIQATLKKGQVYHLITTDKRGASFTGTSVKADKPIAVFAGDVNTDVPGEASARDLLYEQQMPMAFWGTEFVVTRTMERDADRVRITASNNGTEVYVDGVRMMKDNKPLLLNAGETYEIELSEGNIDPSAVNKLENGTKYDYLARDFDAHYINTTCPVAVYLYIVSQKYKNKESTYDNGDPSMVWISPLEQQIKEITFCEFATDKTTDHYVNIVTETSNVESMSATGVQLSASDFQVVPSNPTYSYARVLLERSNPSNPISKTYTLKGKKGFIAHVYGNGEKESYAYSVGSAAIERSIEIGGNKLGNGDSLVICLGEPIEFATNFSNYTVDQITWDMGDGTTKTYYEDATYEYMYDAKGWYDIIVTYSLTNECTNEVVANEDLAVKLYVNIPDTIRNNKFICVGESLNGRTFANAGTFIDTTYNECASVTITTIMVGEPSQSSVELTAFDSVFVKGDEAGNADMYVYQSTTLKRYYKNITGCDSVVDMTINVIQCTDINVTYNEEICGDEYLVFNYRLLKGEMPYQGYLKCGGDNYSLTFKPQTSNSGEIQVYRNITPGKYPNATLYLHDPNCDRTIEINVPLTVKFPSNIVAQKWNNVLAIYNASKNGGFDFVSYQWFKNDSLLAGEQNSILYVGTDNELDFNAYYYVVLTTTSGLTLQSCPFFPADKYAEDPEITPTITPENEDDDVAQVMVSPTIVNAGENLYINSDLDGTVQLYSTTGVFETEKQLGRYTVMQAPNRAGVYIMHVRLADGTTRAMQVIVR